MNRCPFGARVSASYDVQMHIGDSLRSMLRTAAKRGAEIYGFSG